MNQLVLGVLALVAIVIVALAISGTNSTMARIIQGGLIIAIIGVLIRSERVDSNGNSTNAILVAWNNITANALKTTGK